MSFLAHHVVSRAIYGGLTFSGLVSGTLLTIDLNQENFVNMVLRLKLIGNVFASQLLLERDDEIIFT